MTTTKPEKLNQEKKIIKVNKKSKLNGAKKNVKDADEFDSSTDIHRFSPESSSEDIPSSKKSSSTAENPVNSKSRSRIKPTNVSQFTLDSINIWWWPLFMLIIFLSLATRLYKIDEPDHVCWDETHFGKFGSWYINRTFFFDVHPPLGKMMIGLFGVLSGYNGSFPFSKPGDKYGDVPYVGMRMCCVLLGACLAPFAFVTVWEMTQSLIAAVLASSFIVFDNGLVTLSQYILLDPILMFFILGAIMANAKFRSCNERPFGFLWWFWLICTGFFLGCSISVKFVGLFIVLFVGILTIWDLWVILGETNKSLLYSVQHFIGRAFGLIIIPSFLYIIYFYIHLKILNRSGSGDGFFSSAFQSHLIGNSLYNASMPKYVVYGSVITLKNHRTVGGYLHSHWHLYPEGTGAKQQQITTYAHKDDNNKWVIKHFDKQPDINGTIEYVKHGDAIRLEHLPTKRNLHSHKEPAPVTKRHYQVTGYGENGVGDANDVWRVEIVGGKVGDVIVPISSKLRLIHFLNGCALQSHNKQLPKWGYEQMEVTCSPNVRDKNNLWNVEDNYFPKLPNVSVEIHTPSFFQQLIEAHAVMLQGNSGLKPKEGEITSKPWQWPINYRGQAFSGSQYRIYLLGNPVIWWGNLIFLLIFLSLTLIRGVLSIRGHKSNQDVENYWEYTRSSCGWLSLGWMLHYAPFWVMGRVLYFHHYFPALLFNSMLSGIVLDFLLKCLQNCSLFEKYPTFQPTLYHTVFASCLSMLIYSFYVYTPLSYGMHGPLSHEPNSTLSSLRLLDSWEI
ncbi:hypothetical protein CHUAL_010521 [Chamberlinius hualienensis]